MSKNKEPKEFIGDVVTLYDYDDSHQGIIFQIDDGYEISACVDEIVIEGRQQPNSTLCDYEDKYCLIDNYTQGELVDVLTIITSTDTGIQNILHSANASQQSLEGMEYVTIKIYLTEFEVLYE